MADFMCRTMGTLRNTKNKDPVLLSKSLGSYFDERVGEHVESLNEKYKDFYYAPSSEFTLARHEITCLDQKLVHARSAWVEDKKVLVDRWAQAVNRQSAIFERLPQLNPYFKETFGKRERSLKQVAREHEICVVKDREIRRQKKEMEKLFEVKASVEHRLAEFSIYKSYLVATKDASHGEYPDIKDLIDRYGTLADARDNLMTRNNGFRDTVTLRQRALDDDILMKSNEVLAYRNYLSELLEYDSTLQEQVFRLNDSLLRIKTTAAQRTLIIGQIKMSIRNLYLQVCKSLHRHPKIAPEDTLGQLLDVRISIKEMTRLTRDIRRMLKAAQLTARQEALVRMKNMVLAAERLRRMDKLMAKKGALDVRELFGLAPLKPKAVDINKMLLERKN